MAKPKILDDDLIAAICSHVENGASYRAAYLLSGINEWTGMRWRVTGKENIDSDMPEAKLYYEMEVAKARYLQSLVNCVRDAARQTEHWTAAMRLLESADSRTYSKYAAAVEIQCLQSKDQDALAKSHAVIDAIAQGELSPVEGTRIINGLGVIAKIEENTELKNIIDKLEQKLAEKEEEIKILKGENINGEELDQERD